MQTPLVTIITPTYNRGDYVADVIESVLSQGYEPLQYIVLDDGSTDNTKSVVEPYLDRIEFDSHANMGETKTVNRAFSMARGDIICVVNSDDPLRQGAIEAGVKTLLDHPEIVVAYPDWDYIDAEGNVIHAHPVEEYDYKRMLAEHICMPGPAAFFRRSVVEATKGRDENFRYVGDFEFWLRAALVGDFIRIPENLATFRVHPTSASQAAQGRRMASEDIQMLDSYFARHDLPPAASEVRRRAYSSGHYHAAQVCGGAHWLALKHLAKAIKYQPSEFTGAKNAYKRRVALKLFARAANSVIRRPSPKNPSPKPIAAREATG